MSIPVSPNDFEESILLAKSLEQLPIATGFTFGAALTFLLFFLMQSLFGMNQLVSFSDVRAPSVVQSAVIAPDSTLPTRATP